MKWGNEVSSPFRILNGTRQGSVLSPALFSVYIDDMIQDLRKLGLGCYMGGLWIGACGFADDLILLSPGRKGMQKMLEVCEKYASQHSLQFSTDPNPSKSKSKCIFMTGTRRRHKERPAPLKLYGVDLPWVESATHLGHELHQACNMNYDSKCKRARFIDNSTAVREMFKFAKPGQVLHAVQVYCCDMYGSMLWDLFGDQAGQFYRCWNTCVKLCWNVPRSTHTYFIDNLLATEFRTVRQQVMSRYAGFYQSLLNSPSREVAIVSRMVGRNVSTNTGSNLFNISKEFNMDIHRTTPFKLKMSILSSTSQVPSMDQWRLPLLSQYLQIREGLELLCEDTSYIQELINNLCST